MPERAAGGIPRRGRAVLSVAAAANGARTRCTAAWRRWGWEIMWRPACRSWRAKSERQKPREAEFYIVLGDAWRSSRKATGGGCRLRRGGPAESGFGAGIACAGGCAGRMPGELAPRAEILKKALQIAPADPETWYRYGMLDSTPAALPKQSTRFGKRSRWIRVCPRNREGSPRFWRMSGQTG